jgi:cbb3-type cytochrome oxidase cytochrome c subunit
LVRDAKRHFGLWDTGDPVVRALLRVVQAQNDLAHAIERDADMGAERMVEDAIGERVKAVDALVAVLKEDSR